MRRTTVANIFVFCIERQLIESSGGVKTGRAEMLYQQRNYKWGKNKLKYTQLLHNFDHSAAVATKQGWL